MGFLTGFSERPPAQPGHAICVAAVMLKYFCAVETSARNERGTNTLSKRLYSQNVFRSRRLVSMKTFCAVAVVCLSLMGSMSSTSSQPYGYRDQPYGYSDRDYGPRDRDYGRRRRSGFDEREYLNCNPDVLRAVRRGQTSARAHYERFGRREGRRLSC